MVKRLLLTLSVLVLLSPSALADPSFVDDAKVVGKTRFSYYLWDIYDATLMTKSGSWNEEKPFALKLVYHRDFKGEDIAKRSMEEMKKQNAADKATLKRWMKQMKARFPDVKEGDSIIGIVDENHVVEFFHNDMSLGSIKEAEFTQAFFNIWLGDNTSEPDMRDALLGNKT